MNTFKKIFAVAAAAATLGVMSMASISVSAAPAPVEEPPYVIQMSVCAGAEQAWEASVTEVTGDCTGTSEYTFTQGSATIELLLFDSSINMYSFAPEDTADVAKDTSVRFEINNIKIVRADGSEAAITYNGPSDVAFMTGDNGSCMRLNVLNEWTKAEYICNDIDKTLPGEGVAAGDKIVVEWTLSGIAAASEGGDTNDESGATTTTTTGDSGSSDTTTTTTKKNSSSSGSSSNKTNSSNKTSNSTTSSVTKTADAGVVAIVVGAAAAVSLAVGTMTYKRKNK